MHRAKPPPAYAATQRYTVRGQWEATQQVCWQLENMPLLVTAGTIPESCWCAHSEMNIFESTAEIGRLKPLPRNPRAADEATKLWCRAGPMHHSRPFGDHRNLLFGVKLGACVACKRVLVKLL